MDTTAQDSKAQHLRETFSRTGNGPLAGIIVADFGRVSPAPTPRCCSPTSARR